jgi:hypothetical protein
MAGVGSWGLCAAWWLIVVRPGPVVARREPGVLLMTSCPPIDTAIADPGLALVVVIADPDLI